MYFIIDSIQGGILFEPRTWKDKQFLNDIGEDLFVGVDKLSGAWRYVSDESVFALSRNDFTLDFASIFGNTVFGDYRKTSDPKLSFHSVSYYLT